ncbi:hypothetical protein D5F51_13315 [Yersinia hibernica]|uniref:Uncharacterized protein n=2 Tax=Yersinia TaxID=629 RepID=A0ABX5R1F9_9GAMM|nr:hypothetical protein LC20_07075 [Yersinia hibernica]OVZ75351.1 hypothetical protein CBW54_22280 [Yersinia kristensenii]QAX79451.1 hypothetical protein D5F51_13315 [Yersinia hibernica]
MIKLDMQRLTYTSQLEIEPYKQTFASLFIKIKDLNLWSWQATWNLATFHQQGHICGEATN